jgi:nicotinate-nucleotide adenylyltransferase
MSGLFVLYGGTFDPVHDGHLAIARAARDALDAPVRLMPAADPPHRPPPGAVAADRAAMLSLAIEGEPGLVADLRELRRDERSWTIETLRALRREIGAEQPVALLLGEDSFAGLPTWKDWQALFECAHFVVASRALAAPGDDAPASALESAIAGRVVDSADALHRSPAGHVLYLRQPLHPESATAIRAAIRAGAPWRDRVPASVADYIDRHALYRRGDGGGDGGINGAVADPQV